MNPHLRSALIAGVIAGVIYTLIATLTGTGFGAALGVGVLFLVGTAIITYVIATLISRSKTSHRP